MIRTFPPISKSHPLILASASPRRKRLLNQIKLPFRPVPSHIDENGSGNVEYPIRAAFLAKRKAENVYAGVGEHWVLGADTVVILGDRVFGKPRDAEEVHAMLSVLSDLEHKVVTGFAILDPSGAVAHLGTATTRVKLKKITKEEISAYVATGEPFGKAGSYAIQGMGVFLVEGINGSYTNVVGLPLCALIRALVRTGALKRYPLS